MKQRSSRRWVPAPYPGTKALFAVYEDTDLGVIQARVYWPGGGTTLSWLPVHAAPPAGDSLVETDELDDAQRRVWRAAS